MFGRLRAAGNRVYLGIAVAALLLLVATEPPKVQPANSFVNGKAVAKWMVGYYQQPEPHRVADALTMLDVEGGLKSEHRSMTVAAFLAGVIDQDSGVIGPLVAYAAKASFGQKNLVAQAAALSHRREEVLSGVTAKMPGTREAVARLLADSTTADTLRRPIGDAAALDLYWAFFMATGKEEALARILAVVAGTLQETDQKALMLGHAAKWSLTSNAAQHAKVMDACRAAAEDTGPLAEALRDVVSAAEAGDTRRIRQEWQAAMRGWNARHAPALSAAGTKPGA